MDCTEEAASQEEYDETTLQTQTNVVQDSEDELDNTNEDDDEDDLDWTNTDEASDSDNDRDYSDEDSMLGFIEMYGDENLDES